MFGLTSIPTVQPDRAGTIDEALAALDEACPLPRRYLLDATRVLIHLRNPTTVPYADTAQADAAVNRASETPLLGAHKSWTPTQALAVVNPTLGDDAWGHLDHLLWMVGLGVDGAPGRDLSQTDEVTALRCALLLKAGWTQDDGEWWWLARDDVSVPVITLGFAAAWAVVWGLDTLSVCLRAGLRVSELRHILNARTLPDLSTLNTMAALSGVAIR